MLGIPEENNGGFFGYSNTFLKDRVTADSVNFNIGRLSGLVNNAISQSDIINCVIDLSKIKAIVNNIFERRTLQYMVFIVDKNTDSDKIINVLKGI